MSTDLFRQLASRKDIGSAYAVPRGERIAYTDPDSHVVNAAETDTEVTWFLVSTEDVDRDGDIVRSDGWDVKDFLATGGTWLYDHGEHDSRPIGKAIHPQTGEPLLRFEPGKVFGGIYWDSGPWGQEIKGLVEREQVVTASIGFLPTQGRPIPKRGGLGGKRKEAWDIERLSLLELTITPTPSNVNALKLAVDKGDLGPVVLKSFNARIKAMGVLSDTAGGTLPGKEEEKHVDEHAEFKASLEDCVGRKVKILMDEGKDQKQALAIAYSMCGEEHKSAMDIQQEPEGPVEKSADAAGHEHDESGKFSGVAGGHKLSEKANAATAKAHAASGAAKASGSPDAHKAAYRAHRRAADEHYDAGDAIGTLATKAGAKPGDKAAADYFDRTLAIAHSHDAHRAYHQGRAEGHREAARGAAPPKSKSAKSPCVPCGNGRKAVTMPDMADPTQVDDGQAGAEAPDESTVGPVKPPGVTHAQNCLEHCKALLDYIDKQVLPEMEPDSEMRAHFEEKLRPVLHELTAELHGAASEHYPDEDFGEVPEDMEPIPDEGEEGEEEEVEDPEVARDDEGGEGEEKAAIGPGEANTESGEEKEEGMDDEEEKELADRYARSARYRRKHARRKAYRMKAMHKAVCEKAVGHMHGAADHMEAMAEDEATPVEHKYLHMGHAATLRKSAADVSREVIGSEEGGGEEGMPEEGHGGGDMPEEAEKSVGAEVWALTKRLRERLDKVTGKK